MKGKINISIYFYLFLLISINGSGQEILNNYLEIAANNNPHLKAKFSEYHAALEKIPQVGTLPDPKIAFGYFVLPVETRVGPQQVKFAASQMFPWFGMLDAKEDVATDMAKAKYEVFEEAKSRLFYEVKSTYYNLYFISKAIDITKENIIILNTFRRLALIKIEAGIASAVDELRVEMEILDLENQLLNLKDKLYTLEVAFFNLLNINESSTVDLPEILWEDEVSIQKENILDSIRINNHQVLKLEFQLASFQNQEKVAEKMGKPSFSLGLDYTMVGESSNANLPANESGKDVFLLPKVGISVPLYRKKYTAMVKEAIYLQEATSNKKVDKVNVLETSFEKTNADYLDSDRRIRLHEKQLKLAGKSLNILETEYAVNGKNFEEILRMERKVLMHNLQLEKSRADKNAANAFINYLMGR